MTDFLTELERSKRMSLIRGKWTKQEKKVHNALKGLHIKHKMHPDVPGNPDVLIGRTAVFLNGCFWHKCPKCYKEPQSRKEYWVPKIIANVARDKKKSRMLRKVGFKVIVLWEHDIQTNFQKSLDKVLLESRKLLND